MRIALYQGKSLISLLIRWQTRSQYSHAAFLLDDGSVIEAWQPCVREITPFPNLLRTAPVLGRSNANNQAGESSSYADAARSPNPQAFRDSEQFYAGKPSASGLGNPSAICNPQSAALSRQHTPGTTVDIFKFITPLTSDENRHLEYLARRDVGTPYDYRGIVRFLTRQRDGRSRRLFCSEQVFARCQQIGRPLLDRTEAWRVPPDWLARSPHLQLDQTITTA